jgi:hypothetical protein
MGSLCDFAELEVLDHILKVGSYSPPATVYLALFTADPTDTGSMANEATYTGYARKAITFGAASARAITQNAQVDFDPCSGGSNTITHWGLCTSVTFQGGSMLAYGAFSAGVVVSSGYQPYVASGQISVSFNTGGVSTAYANSILDWLFRGQSLSQPTNIYIALFSTACSDSAAGTELTGNGYARAQCNTWDTASGGASQNTNAVTFAQATGAWSTATFAALYDSITGGTYMLYCDINDLAVASGEYARFIAGAFDVTLS